MVWGGLRWFVVVEVILDSMFLANRQSDGETNKESSPVVLEVSVMGSIIKQLECNDFAIRKNAINLLNTLMRDDACDVQTSYYECSYGCFKDRRPAAGGARIYSK
uniref:Uncharacterized protein n=1 Tax=Ditylenchus dipsaci TaxID=166011 RepID=A0A915EPU3_9BILA